MKDRLSVVLVYLLLFSLAISLFVPWVVIASLLLAAGLLVLIISYTWLVHVLSYADARFSLPVMPYVLLLGAGALAQLRAPAPARVISGLSNNAA